MASTNSVRAGVNFGNALPDSLVEDYRRDGFVKIAGIISPEEVREFRQASLEASERLGHDPGVSIFDQHVNNWPNDPLFARLTLHPNVAAAAAKLAGVPLRLWHDHILIKRPGMSVPTAAHQDQPYWPHANSTHPISAWIALGDVSVEMGCMSFIPGSHLRTDLPVQNLGPGGQLFDIEPEMAWLPRVTVPLKAGDCTFHHGRCVHMAGQNSMDEPRVAYVIIFMDATTTYTGASHIVTDPLGLSKGAVLDGPMFPLIDTTGMTIR